jgi:hypothetical protein
MPTQVGRERPAPRALVHSVTEPAVASGRGGCPPDMLLDCTVPGLAQGVLPHSMWCTAVSNQAGVFTISDNRHLPGLVFCPHQHTASDMLLRYSITCCPPDEEMPKYQSHLREESVSQRCQAMAISDMAVCYVDRSYSIKHGCCSKRCSQGFKRVSGRNDATGRRGRTAAKLTWLSCCRSHDQRTTLFQGASQ